jgi:hypothetical protein
MLADADQVTVYGDIGEAIILERLEYLAYTPQCCVDTMATVAHILVSPQERSELLPRVAQTTVKQKVAQ